MQYGTASCVNFSVASIHLTRYAVVVPESRPVPLQMDKRVACHHPCFHGIDMHGLMTQNEHLILWKDNCNVPGNMRWCMLWVLCLGVAMCCISAHGFEYELVRAASAASQGVGITELNASRFPASRPKAPKGGWNMCTYT
jgi:hypothetical protein